MTKSKAPEIITAKTTPAQLEEFKLSCPPRFWFGVEIGGHTDNVIIIAGGTQTPCTPAARARLFRMSALPVRISVAVEEESIPEGFSPVETFKNWAGVYTPAGRGFLIQSRGQIAAYDDGNAAIIFQVDDVSRLNYAAYPAGGRPPYLEGDYHDFYLTD